MTHYPDFDGSFSLPYDADREGFDSGGPGGYGPPPADEHRPGIPDAESFNELLEQRATLATRTPSFYMTVLAGGSTIPELENEAIAAVQKATKWPARLVIVRPYVVHQIPPAAKLVTGTVCQEVQELAEAGHTLSADIKVAGYGPVVSLTMSQPGGGSVTGYPLPYAVHAALVRLGTILGVNTASGMSGQPLIEACIQAAGQLAHQAMSDQIARQLEQDMTGFPGVRQKHLTLADFAVAAKPAGPAPVPREEAITELSASPHISRAEAEAICDQAASTGLGVPTSVVTVTYDASAQEYELDWHQEEPAP